MRHGGCGLCLFLWLRGDKESPEINHLIESLRKHRVEDKVIISAMAEMQEASI